MEMRGFALKTKSKNWKKNLPTSSWQEIPKNIYSKSIDKYLKNLI